MEVKNFEGGKIISKKQQARCAGKFESDFKVARIQMLQIEVSCKSDSNKMLLKLLLMRKEGTRRENRAYGIKRTETEKDCAKGRRKKWMQFKYYAVHTVVRYYNLSEKNEASVACLLHETERLIKN